MSTTTDGVVDQRGDIEVLSEQQDRISVVPEASWRRFSKTHEDALVITGAFLFGFLMTLTWFEPGKFISTGDIRPYVREGMYGQVGWLWNYSITGAGAPTTAIGFTYDVAILKITGALGIAPWIAQYTAFSIALGTAGAGAAYFARSLGVRGRYALLAAFVAVANPFSLTFLPNLLPYFALGMVGALGGLIIRASRPDGRSHVIAFGFVSVAISYLSINPPLLAIVAIGCAVIVAFIAAIHGKAGVRRCAVFLAKAVPLALAMNAWWIVPILQTLRSSSEGTTFTAVTDVASWQFTHARSSIANATSLTGSWGWPFPEYYPWSRTLDGAPFDIIRYALPALAFAAPFVALRSRRWTAALMAVTSLLLIFLSKGIHQPLGGANDWMYAHVPGFWLFREPVTKFGPVLVLLYGALAAMALEGLVVRFRSGHRGETVKQSRIRYASIGMAGLAVASVVAMSYPMFSGSVIPDKRPLLPPAHVALPDQWRDAASYVNGDSVPGKALMLPYNDFYQMPTDWGYYGADLLARDMIRRPILMRVPNNYYGEKPAVDALLTNVERAIRDDDTQAARQALDELGVSHVILRRDFAPETVSGRDIVDPSAYEKGLDDLGRDERNFGVADVFHVSTTDDTTFSIEADGTAPDVDWKNVNPAKYTARVTQAPSDYTVVMRDSFSAGWKLTGLPAGARSEHFVADGYANGWRITGAGPDADITVEYRPAAIGQFAIRLSVVTATVSLLIGSAVIVRRRRPA